MIDFESNEILSTNLFFGSEKLLSFKKAIRRLGYNPDCESISSLEAAKNIVDGFKNNGGSLVDIFELRIFLLESFILCMSDFGCDFEGEFFDAVMDEFEKTVLDLKKAGKDLLDNYSPRFSELIKEVNSSDESLGETLIDLWE